MLAGASFLLGQQTLESGTPVQFSWANWSCPTRCVGAKFSSEFRIEVSDGPTRLEISVREINKQPPGANVTHGLAGKFGGNPSYPDNYDFTVSPSSKLVLVRDGSAGGLRTGSYYLQQAISGIGPVTASITSEVTATLTGGSTPVITTVSAASYTPSAPLAPGVIAAGSGTNLASTAEIAPATGPLPTVLAQTSVTVRDSAGVEHTAPLWFVSPSQIIYYIPDETALGQATITVVRNSQTVATGTLQIDTVAPGLFTMNANGQGVPAALAIFAKGDGSQTWQYVFNAGCLAGSCQPAPLDLGAVTDQVFLRLYGTGIRGRSSLAAVTAKIGGVDARVDYAGPVAGFAGLDQVDLLLPRALIGRGQADVALIVDGKTANTVTVNIK